MKDKLAGLLGMAKRAGKIQTGFDETVSQVRKGKAALVLFAADLSEKSAKEWRFATRQHSINCRSIILTKTALARCLGLGRETGIVAVCDEGFAKAVAAYCPEEKEDETYGSSH